MKIAVLDGGIISEFKDGLNIVEDLMVNSENLVINRPEGVPVITDHGLNVCKIINMYAPKAEIISIRIFSTLEMRTSIETLIAAFKYCLDNKIPIIHFSGGTVNLIDDFLLKDLIKKVINNGQIIVAAHSNNTGLSFPALYPNVFSARANELLDFQREIRSIWGYSFFMPSKHKININNNFSYITQIANSYAAPVLTANIYNIINSSCDSKTSTILRNLGESHNYFLCELPCFLDKVTIINLDREVILEEVLFFEVRNIYYDISFEVDSGDYIFISHKDKKNNIKKFKEFLNAIPVNDTRNRIFYLGIRDREIESIMSCYPFEFWMSPANEVYPICASKYDLSNCATIYFEGNKEVVYYIMTQLRDIFLKDGFNCFAISDLLDAVFYGIYYFNDLNNSIRRQQLEYVLEPDVELLYSKTGYCREIEDSMLIEVMEERDSIELFISVGNTKEEVSIYGEKDLKKLFTRIIKLE